MFKQIPVSKKAIALRRLVCGVGVNDAPYITGVKGAAGKVVMCPYYTVWAAMLVRCFSAKLHAKRPTYANCTLEKSWEYFTTFKHWMEQQDWQGKVLDKDILVQGNKHYGPDTCIFITKELNNLLTVRGNSRGKYPIGVSETSMRGYSYFVASCSFYGKQKRLGYFKTIESAAQTYKEAKLGYIKELAQKEQNPKIKQALLNIS